MTSWTRQEWQRFAASFSLGLLVIGFILGSNYIDLKNKGFFQAWELLGEPPVQPIKIVSASYGSINVQTNDGSIYSRCTKYCPYDPRFPQANWIPTASSIEQKDPDQQPRFDQPLAKQPPSRVIDTVKFQFALPEAVADIQYAITEDGRVWRWESGGGIGIGITGICIIPLAGLLIGLIISFVLYKGQNEIQG